MFVGHGLLAFAVVGLLSRRFGANARRALALGVVAALFATLPDVDILYGPIGILGGVSGLGDAVDTFWATGNVVHRGPTHSLVIGALAAGGFALVARKALVARLAGVGILAGLVALTATVSGALDAAIVTAFALGGLAIVALARRLELPATAVLATALFGLVSHPFGDLVTGSPPDLLYPFDVALLTERVILHPDATLNLLATFAIELSVIWFAFYAYCELTDRRLGARIDRRATLGVAYGAAAIVLPSPSIQNASPFVFSVLSLGFVGAIPTRGSVRPELDRLVGTGLAAVTLAAAAFAVVYLIV